MTKQQPTNVPLQLQHVAVSFSTESFDNLVGDHGLPFCHWRAMRCPVGLIDRFDIRRPHDDHSGCSNGFIYTLAGRLTCLYSGNGHHVNVQDLALLDDSTVTVTIPRTYDNTEEPVFVAKYDRFYLDDPEIVVPNWQLFESSALGRDRLQFPVVRVQDLIDSNNRHYSQGTDFELKEGQIVWTGARPLFDAEAGKGSICAIRYLYRPYYIVERLLHEVRVARADAPDGSNRVQRMPQQLSLQREYVYENEANDELAPTSARQVPGPRDGSLVSR